MKLRIGIYLLALASSIQLAEASTNAFALFFPPSDRIKAQIEEQFNHSFEVGAAFGHGQGRDNFLGVGPWERGWVMKGPDLAYRLGYGFNTHFELSGQVSYYLGASNVEVYFSPVRYLGVGARLGGLSSVFAIGSIYMHNFFISFSPSVHLVKFGEGEETVDTTEFLGPTSSEQLKQSKVVYQGQVAIGFHNDPYDVALLATYGYAPGRGVIAESFLEDILLKKFVRAAIAFSF